MTIDKDRFGSIFAGLAIAGVVAVTRKARRGVSPHNVDPKECREHASNLGDQVRDAFVTAFNNVSEDMEAERAEDQILKKVIGKGANDPGAQIVIPSPRETIVINRYGPGVSFDQQRNVFLAGSLNYIHWFEFGKSAIWRLVEREGNFENYFELKGTFSKGWRTDKGRALAITITHVSDDVFFPYRSSVYRQDFDLQLFADLLEAARVHRINQCEAADERSKSRRKLRKIPDRLKHVVVIDNREAHRAEHKRQAAFETTDAVRLTNGKTIPLTLAEKGGLTLCEPDPMVWYDATAKIWRDDQTGLSMEIVQRREGHGSRNDGILFKGGLRLCRIAIEHHRCWRPEVGPTALILFDLMDGTLAPLDDAEAAFPSKNLLPRIGALLNARRSRGPNGSERNVAMMLKKSDYRDMFQS